jgi:asparagine synthetase B (glutamine-hydrolysing)
MCGFVASSGEITTSFAKVRGPDHTSSVNIDGINYVHHLLHITGEFTPQPFVQDNLVCLFNGEIYNYRDFGDYSSDGFCILDVYRKEGIDFAKKFDGEFAIVIVDNGTIVVATDPFATKPLHVRFGEHWTVGSYNRDVGGQRVPANTVIRYDFKGKILEKSTSCDWDLSQFKTSTDDWISAFKDSIKKRVHPKLFLGLSSGYDSGAISCELNRIGAPFRAYSITNNESERTLTQRFQILKDVNAFELSEVEFGQWKKHMRSAEDFSYFSRFLAYDYKNDRATMGLASICSRANQDGLRVYMSGQGADEILSDYGFGGRKHYGHSEFGGLFPKEQKLWYSFNDGTQIQYLNKEEFTAGHFGIEARYPFLDKQLVQEFLWLTPEVKNRNYKSPLHDYLESCNFPFDKGKKLGFTPFIR